MRRFVAAALLVSAGFAAGWFVRDWAVPSRPMALPPETVPLALGEFVDLSSDGMADGNHFFRRLRVLRIVADPNRITGPASGPDEKNKQHWTLQTGAGAERVAVVLVEH
jgi:hypothetical protein